jgi:hypothetical protein
MRFERQMRGDGASRRPKPQKGRRSALMRPNAAATARRGGLLRSSPYPRALTIIWPISIPIGSDSTSHARAMDRTIAMGPHMNPKRRGVASQGLICGVSATTKTVTRYG